MVDGSGDQRDDGRLAPPEPFLTAAQIAEFLSVSVATVRRMTAQGMPSHVLLSRTRRYRASEVAAWVQRERGAA